MHPMKPIKYNSMLDLSTSKSNVYNSLSHNRSTCKPRIKSSIHLQEKKEILLSLCLPPIGYAPLG